MKCILFGYGKMGQCIKWAMEKLGYEVITVDKKNADLKIDLTHPPLSSEIISKFLKSESPQVVISSLPHNLNFELARLCLNRDINYCDLGGDELTSKKIYNYRKEINSKSLLSIDLGLAPGLVNILAERGYQKLTEKNEEIYSIDIYCGGFPSISSLLPLKYSCNWSIDGLLNNYNSLCQVLLHGEIIDVNPCHSVFDVDILGSKFEAFYTAGVLHNTIKLMKNRKVKFCTYKTVRSCGHLQAISHLQHRSDCSKDLLKSILSIACNEPDIVFIKIVIKTTSEISWTKELCIRWDKQWSAMQKSTAITAAVVADQMIKYNKNMNYENIDFPFFQMKLKDLGLKI